MKGQIVEELDGTEKLRQSENNLYYPKSNYYNIRGAALNSTLGLPY